MQELAAAALGEQFKRYVPQTDNSGVPIPQSEEITFVPVVSEVEFNPPSQTFRWLKSVHKAEFEFRAESAANGRTLTGQFRVFVGVRLAASISLKLRFDASAPSEPVPTVPARAPQRQKIFASYSHDDVAIVEQFERYVETLGHRYLRDARDLRSGQVWNDELMRMIDEADVFQLFWSVRSMRSRFVRQEWEYALTLKNKGEGFVCPTYWETPCRLGFRRPTWHGFILRDWLRAVACKTP